MDSFFDNECFYILFSNFHLAKTHPYSKMAISYGNISGQTIALLHNMSERSPLVTWQIYRSIYLSDVYAQSPNTNLAQNPTIQWKY